MIVPYNKLKDLGLLIYNESIKGNNVDELLNEFINLSKDPENNIDYVDLTNFGLDEVIINDKFLTNGLERVVPFLNYVFNQDRLIDALEKSDSCITAFIYNLRDVFHIQGGLRIRTFRYYKDGALCVILDFTEYKCNEIYEKIL